MLLVARWCSGRRRAQPPARAFGLVGCDVAGVLGAVGSGRPRDRHTRACGSEWSISKPALALRTLRRPPYRRRLRCCVCGGAPARCPARPRGPRGGLLLVGICGSSELSVGERVLVGGEHEGRQKPRRHPNPASIARMGTPQQQPFRPDKIRQHTPRSKPLGRLRSAAATRPLRCTPWQQDAGIRWQ